MRYAFLLLYLLQSSGHSSCIWEALRNPITHFQVWQTQGHLNKVTSCMLWYIIYILGLLHFATAQFLWWASYWVHVLPVWFLFVCLFRLYLSHINLEIEVKGREWEMHCQLAEHETFCVSLIREYEGSSNFLTTPLVPPVLVGEQTFLNQLTLNLTD